MLTFQNCWQRRSNLPVIFSYEHASSHLVWDQFSPTTNLFTVATLMAASQSLPFRSTLRFGLRRPRTATRLFSHLNSILDYEQTVVPIRWYAFFKLIIFDYSPCWANFRYKFMVYVVRSHQICSLPDLQNLKKALFRGICLFINLWSILDYFRSIRHGKNSKTWVRRLCDCE